MSKIEAGARIYRPSFRENEPKTLVISHRKRAFWACFRENWVYTFGHLVAKQIYPDSGRLLSDYLVS
jgi:hypothetical protein